ncbi:helix-turn-helix domain-containing protein [Pseudonocardia ailaonensis]|uniref:Helix-turn-helix domain-containing protein n=1 Tax=Pseudonocardia ailaonensis TaxID=367279 RepID=A0ABN2N228_9PSEU
MADDLAPWVRELAAGFDVAATTEAVVAADLAAVWPERIGDDGFAGMLRASVEENVTTLRDLLAGRIPPGLPDLKRPTEFARAQAELRLPQTALQHSYRVGFLAIWERWAEHLTAGAGPGDDLSTALRDSTRMVFAYQDRAMRTVARAYARVDEALRDSREHLRHGIVRQLLADPAAPPPDRDLRLTLGYDVGATHVAVLLTGGDTLGSPVAAQQLRYRLDEHRTVLWFGRPTWADTEDLAEALDGTTASVGSPAPGLAGFRATFAEAEQVERVRARLGTPGVVTIADVRLEALLGGGDPGKPDRAARFVADELRGLADDGPEGERLRETLRTWFATGSHVGTAKALGLHEHTVRNRLRRAEELLGRPVTERRTEIQVALRLLPLTRG